MVRGRMTPPQDSVSDVERAQCANEDGTPDFYRTAPLRSTILYAIERNWNAGPDALVDAIIAALAVPINKSGEDAK